MKRISLSVLFVAMSFVSVFAQAVKVQSTVNYLKNRQLNLAKEAIDAATVHEKTMNDPKTWHYKGTVYLELHLVSTMTEGLEKGMTPADIKQKYRDPISTKNVNIDGGAKAVRWEYGDQMYLYFQDNVLVKWDEPAGGKFNKLADNPLMTAYDCFQHSISLDKNKIYENMNMIQLFVCGEQFFNKGAVYFNSRDFSNSLAHFEKTIKINEIFERKDSIASYYAGQSALQLNDTATAIKYFRSVVNLKYSEPKAYTGLADLYIKQRDTVRAIKALESGKAVLPGDYSIIVAEANIYIMKGDMDKAQSLLEIAVQKNPNNHIIHYFIGTTYADKLEGMDYDKETALYLQFFGNAEKYYKSCIQLKPDMLEANFNLGVLYFNEGLRILKIVDKMTDPAKIEETEKLFKTKWEQAAPYLEKALEIQPNDYNTLLTLKSLYARTNQLEKSIDMDNRLKALPNKTN